MRGTSAEADNSDVDERQVLVDRETGLHVGWYFWLRVLDEVRRSDRYGSPFALLLLDAGQGGHRVQHDLARLPGVIRSTDLGGMLGTGRAGVLLTEQEPEGAGIAAGRVLAHLLASGITWRSELLCYPRDAAAITHLLTMPEPERRAG